MSAAIIVKRGTVDNYQLVHTCVVQSHPDTSSPADVTKRTHHLGKLEGGTVAEKEYCKISQHSSYKKNTLMRRLDCGIIVSYAKMQCRHLAIGHRTSAYRHN